MSLKVGVIGVGGIAGSHMPGWSAAKNAEAIAASDIDPTILNNFADKWSLSRRYAAAKDLIADPDIQIVDICTPNRYHAELAIAALNAGKHVICEKPLAPTPQEIQRMIEARDRSGKLLMTAQHFRFKGNAQAMKRELSAGTLGEIYHARSWMLRRYLLPNRPGFILQEHSGGGPCIDIGVHILDLTLWFMGNPKAVAVSGVAKAPLAHIPGAFSPWGGVIDSRMDVEDFAAAFVRFENGATLMFEVSWMLHHDTEGEDMQMWLYGTKAGSHWPKNQIYSTNYQTQQHYNTQLKLNADSMEPHALECVEFANAITEGRPSPVPAEQSLQVMSVLDAIYRSQRDGREVQI